MAAKLLEHACCSARPPLLLLANQRTPSRTHLGWIQKHHVNSTLEQSSHGKNILKEGFSQIFQAVFTLFFVDPDLFHTSQLKSDFHTYGKKGLLTLGNNYTLLAEQKCVFA